MKNPEDDGPKTPEKQGGPKTGEGKSFYYYIRVNFVDLD
jgi:hypothetical protein